MAIATSNVTITYVGKDGYLTDLPVKGAVHIFEGTLVTQLTASGYVVPYSTASSEHCVGVATHEQDNTAGADGAKRLRVETMRAFVFANGAGGDAFADTDILGIPVFGTDDHTVAKTSSSGARKPVGTFMGLEADGRVRVFINPAIGHLFSVNTLT